MADDPTANQYNVIKRGKRIIVANLNLELQFRTLNLLLVYEILRRRKVLLREVKIL